MVKVLKTNKQTNNWGPGPQSWNHEEVNSANNLHKLGTGPWAANENTAQLAP